jgi:imidazolonepropionase-like amidohydrolase
VALLGATIIDGSGGPVLLDGGIVVRDGRIEAIGSRETLILPRGTETIEVGGRFIIPGLIDAHTTVAPWAIPRYLEFGVTTVRDLHGDLEPALAAMRQSRDTAWRGPRIFSAGATVDGPGASVPAIAAADDRSARQAVDRLSIAGVMAVGAGPGLTPELLRAVVDEAGTFGLPVAAHLGLTDVLRASRFGVRSIEHLGGVAEALAPNAAQIVAAHRQGSTAGWTMAERAWAGLDSAALARAASQVAAARVTLVPTLVLHETLSRLDDSTVYRDPSLRLVPEEVRRGWDLPNLVRQAGWTSGDFASFRAARSRQDLFVREFLRAGGTIVAGTGSPHELMVPGQALHQELELLVRAGLSPAQALLTATRDAARLAGADSVGVLAVGKGADLVVLGANPLQDIRNTRAIERVMVRGRLLSPDSLQAR